jgi:hypothetical protein
LQGAYYSQIDFMGIRDAFCLFYDAKTKTVKALNGSGRAPADLDIDYALSRGHKERIPFTDLNSVTVPGQQILVFLAEFVLRHFYSSCRGLDRHPPAFWK